MVSLAWPLGLLGLAALPIVWWLHRRKRHLPQRLIPSLAPWLALTGRPPQPKRRVPPSVLLALRLLIAGLLAVALARPELHTGTVPRQGRVVLLDTSTSMAAAQRWPEAAAAVRAELAGLERGAALIAVGARPSLVWRDGRGLDSALAELRPGGTGADLAAGLALARAVQPEAELVVIDDGGLQQQAGASRVDRWRRVGASADNLALLDVQLEPVAGGGNGSRQLFARVASFAEGERAVPLALRIDGGPPVVQEIVLQAGATKELTWSLPEGLSEAELALEVEDALSWDDRAVVPLDDRRPRVQWLGDSEVVARALAALPLAELRRAAAARLSADARFDVTVVVGPVPEALPAGGLVLIDPPPGPWLDAAAEPLTLTLGASIAHPLTRGLDVPGTTVAGARAVAAPGWARVVLRDAERALMWEGRAENRRVVVLAFDPERGDIARRAALPVMLDRAIRLAAAIPPPVLAAQERLSPPERMGLEARVRTPDGRLLSAAEVPTRGLLPGTWRLEGRRAGLVGEDAGVVLSVLVPAGDLVESDLRAPPPLPPERQGDMEGSPGAQGRRALWPAIALLAGVLMLVEGVSVSALGGTSARENAAPRVGAKKGALGWLAAQRSRRGTG